MTTNSLGTPAAPLAISERAIALAEQCGIIDLHIDTLIAPRLWGYDPLKQHGLGVLRGRFFGLLDVPRLRAARVSGAMWSLTTNPFRSAAGRDRVWRRNLRAFHDFVGRAGDQVAVARTADDYDDAKQRSRHAIICAVQGANAWQSELQAAGHLDAVLGDGLVARATLVHLTDSAIGATSSPLTVRRDKRLTELGRSLIAHMDRHRVLVDVAHAHEQTFFDAVAAHDPALPLVATHTGVSGVCPHWRNLTDDQIRAIAGTGGVVGIIAAENFLRRSGGPSGLAMLLEHMEHAMKVGGEQCAAIGTDLDGAIVPPQPLRDGLGHLRLVDAMLDRGWGEALTAKVCAGNFLRCWRKMRPHGWQPAQLPSAAQTGVT